MATIGVTRGLGDHDLKVHDSNIYIKPFLSSAPEVPHGVFVSLLYAIFYMSPPVTHTHIQTVADLGHRCLCSVSRGYFFSPLHSHFVPVPTLITSCPDTEAHPSPRGILCHLSPAYVLPSGQFS